MKINHELHTLTNGAKILLIPSDSVNSISINATLKSGSTLENIKNQGITHFVEHMTLTCTKQWPTKELLNEAIEFNGGKTNGETDQEYLDYSINIPNTKLEFGLNYINDVLYNSIFEDNNIEIERTIIIDEISKYDDNVYFKAAEFIDNKTLKNKSSYTFDIAGTIDTVKNFTKDQLVEYYKISHAPDRLLISIIGNFDIAEAKKLVDKYFSQHIKGSVEPKYPDEKLIENVIACKSSRKTDLIISETIFKYKGIHDITFKNSIIANFVSRTLSGPMSSRLMKRLREKEGLLYGIHCGTHSKLPFGKIHISFEVKPEFYEKTLGILNEELTKFYNDGITTKELEHYREYLTNRLIVKYDNIYSYSHLIRTPVFYDESAKSLEEMLSIMKNLTLEDINGFIKEHFNPATASYIAYGNVKKEHKEILSKIVSK